MRSEQGLDFRSSVVGFFASFTGALAFLPMSASVCARLRLASFTLSFQGLPACNVRAHACFPCMLIAQAFICLKINSVVMFQ